MGINTNPTEKLDVDGIARARGLKIPFTDGGAGNTEFRIQPNDGSGNFNAYWNSNGTVGPTAFANAPGYKINYNAVPTGDFRILAAETVAAGDAQNFITAFTIEGNGDVAIGNIGAIA